MSLLKQETTKNGQVHKFLKLKLDIREDKKYEIEAIKNNTVYNKAAES